jgi:hypothetical protein
MKKEEQIKVIIVEPSKAARVEVIQNDLKTLQSLVSGYIEHIREEGFDIIINEEGKLLELEPNFALFGGDYIAGTAIFAGVDYRQGELKSLTTEQIKMITAVFKGRNEVKNGATH